MYILKNALRCIGRAKGRNVLIGIIALVIAVSACIGLSIRQASESAKEQTLEGLSVTATISYDRSSKMNDIFSGGRPQGGERPEVSFDRDQFASMMGSAEELTLDEYEKYAKASSVDDFYYTITASFNGNDSLLPVSDETNDDTEDTQENGNSSQNGFGGGFMGGFGGNFMGGGSFSSADFSIIGYSSYSAMTDFVSGTASILEGGTMFTEGTTEYECVISEELSLYNNSLAIGDIITIVNPIARNRNLRA